MARATDYKLVKSHTYYKSGKRATDSDILARFEDVASNDSVALVEIDGCNVADVFYKASHIDTHTFAALWLHFYGDVLSDVDTVALVGTYEASPFTVADVLTSYKSGDSDKLMQVDRKASVSTFDDSFSVRVVGEIHRAKGVSSSLVGRVYEVTDHGTVSQFVAKVYKDRVVLRRYSFSSFFKALDKRIASACNVLASVRTRKDGHYHKMALDLVRMNEGESRIRNMVASDIDIEFLKSLLNK